MPPVMLAGGLKFLRHIERTELLLIIIESSSENIRKDYDILLQELNNYSNILSAKKKIVGISKVDLLSENEIDKLSQDAMKIFSEDFIVFSAVSGYNIQELLDFIWKNLHQ